VTFVVPTARSRSTQRWVTRTATASLSPTFITSCASAPMASNVTGVLQHARNPKFSHRTPSAKCPHTENKNLWLLPCTVANIETKQMNVVYSLCEYDIRRLTVMFTRTQHQTSNPQSENSNPHSSIIFIYHPLHNYHCCC
jgi:hypothetical protein